jgi:hypothetical protein
VLGMLAGGARGQGAEKAGTKACACAALRVASNVGDRASKRLSSGCGCHIITVRLAALGAHDETESDGG